MRIRLAALIARIACTFNRQRLQDETVDELRAHIDLLTDRYVRDGMTPADARVAARRQMGNVTLAREDADRMNGIGWFDHLAQDLRYAFRQLRHAPAFAAVVIATLALGIGGTTAVFSVVQSVLLAPLPYEQPGQLVRIYQQESGNPASRGPVAAALFTVLRANNSSFDDVAAVYTYSETGLDLFSGGRAERLRVLRVTSDYFSTLRAPPLRGRGFDASDETGTHRVVLSDRLWRTRFAGDRSIIGTSIQLNGEPYEVAGVAPPNFDDPFVGAPDLWTPHRLAGDTEPDNGSLTVIARRRNGVSAEQADAELAALSQSLKERWPTVRASALVALPLQEDVVTDARGPLQLLLLAIGLVLLVACVNVANLVLIRSTGRAHEFAVRAALGSGRGRLARQLLVESLLLAGLGGLAGCAMAALGVSTLRALGRDALPRINQVSFDPLVLGFAMLITVATAVVSGVAPAWRLVRTSPTEALRQQSRSFTGSRRQGRVRGGLAAAQLAFALTLLAGAGVLLASFQRLQQVDLGFRVNQVLTFNVSLPPVRYDATRRAAFQEALARRIGEIPGVTAAGGTSRLPGTGSYHPWTTRIESGPLAGTSVREPAPVQQRTVSGGFFETFDIPLLAGRIFDERDTRDAPMRAVVGAGFARAAFPGTPLESVIGQRLFVGGGPREIVGVVGDISLDVYGNPALVVYHAHQQFAGNRNWLLSQAVATTLPPETMLNAVRATVTSMDPELAVFNAMPMTDVVGRGASRERFALILMGAFAAIALLLAALGLYGVLAYTVRERTPEIGIRMALGATAANVRTLVFRQAALVVGIGLLAGVSGAMVLGRWLTSLVFKTSPWDPRVLLTTALLLTITALIATWLPARRASRIEPKIAMHERA